MIVMVVTVLLFVAVLAALALAVIVLWRTRGVRDSVDRLERATLDSQAEFDALSAERDRLTEALRSFEDGVVVVDAAGAEVVRNPMAARFAGARHADALAEDAIEELLQRARGGDWGERELQLFGPPREVLHLVAVPLRAGGELVGAAAFVRDVTEARRTESIRRDFVANVSHELKTPIGALGLLAETLESADDPGIVAQLADRMVREADRLGRIVDDLLDLSLIEAQEAPTREPVPVRIILSDSVERVRAAADAADISVSLDDVVPDLVVDCDQRQVVGALTNLLDNAVKYSDPGGAVEVTAVDGGDRVVLEVRDHGIGIPQRDLERIFERFYRVDRARSRVTGGTGLGLSIVRHVAQAHGGDVMVESREGEGSTFRFVLPLQPRTARPVMVPDIAEDARW
jgi:two-component system, OmpR family, sensor histidine kinase SenX3